MSGVFWKIGKDDTRPLQGCLHENPRNPGDILLPDLLYRPKLLLCVLLGPGSS